MYATSLQLHVTGAIGAIVHAINQNENLYVFLNYIISGACTECAHQILYNCILSLAVANINEIEDVNVKERKDAHAKEPRQRY